MKKNTKKAGGGGEKLQNFFWPFLPYIGQKIRGTGPPRAPPLDPPLQETDLFVLNL